MAASNFWYDTKGDTVIIGHKDADKEPMEIQSKQLAKDLDTSNQREQHTILKAKWELAHDNPD
jgi:hypothetical protein